MRATWFGARSGLSSTVTGPRLVSIMSVSSADAMSNPLLLGLKQFGRGLFRRIVGVGGVRVVGARRADGAALEARAVAELGREVGILRAAGSGAGRVAGLRHEAG